ncbi:formyl transferase [Candidatus Pacearchaeota archaeon]|nr:formyl transferase [Candidatus Pacearchaeota archaeon]
MAIKELYNPERGKMRVAGLMSGSGSNLRKIIEHEKSLEEENGRSPYQVIVIFSDNPLSKVDEIGAKHKIPVIIRDLDAFYKERGKPKKDLTVRVDFDNETLELLKPYDVDVAAYAGYRSIATAPLLNAFLGVNVHPADLSIMDGNKRKFTGDKAVRDAIITGEKQIRATTHIIEPQVDYGRILMISFPLAVVIPENFDPRNNEQVKLIAKEHQDRLKEVGDWVIFPRTLEYIAEGRYSQDFRGNLYFDGESIPQGLRL